MDQTCGNSQWLLDFLNSAVEKKLCTSVRCTTCGARDFRSELAAETRKAFADIPRDDWQAKASKSGLHGPGSEIVFFLTDSFAQVCLSKGDQHRLRSAAMLMIFDLERIFASTGNTFLLDQLFENSWAGEVLTAMRAHYEMDKQRWRERDEREHKRAEKAVRHLASVPQKNDR